MPPSAPAEPLRRRQRPIGSCTFCYKQKVRCDRQFPCSNCRRRGRGVECVQAPSLVHGVIIGGRPEEPERLLSIEELRIENAILRERLAKAEAGPSRSPTARKPTVDTGPALKVAFHGTAHELLNIGRKVQNAGADATSFTPTLTTTFAEYVSIIPATVSARLVDAYFADLHWYHGVLHEPTYRKWHDEWIIQAILGLAPEDWAMMALYFAVTACSIFFMEPDAAMAIGFTTDQQVSLARAWTAATIDCLAKANYAVNPRLEVLQVICILPAVGHNFHASDYMRSYNHTGLQLAQDLQIHLLSSKEEGAGFLRRELGRRAWVNLSIAETLTPIAYDPCPLIYPSAAVCAPQNLDDAGIGDNPRNGLPMDQHTVATHLILMSRMADVYRHYHLTLTAASTMEERFAVVTDCDERLSHLFDDAPLFASAKRTTDPALVRPQYMIQLTTNLTKIQFYRPFFLRAYDDEKYAMSRLICLEAAYAILQCTDGTNPIPSMCAKLCWASFEVVVAASILVVEYAKGDKDIEVRGQLRKTIETALGWLAERSSYIAFAERGQTELQAFLDRVLAVNDEKPAGGGSAGDGEGGDFLAQYLDVLGQGL